MRRIDLSVTVAATLTESGGGRGTFHYTFPLTTESAAATDRRGTGSVEVTGVRPSDGVWHVQLVGATTNRENAFPAPGTAVYTVLSGTFDHLP